MLQNFDEDNYTFKRMYQVLKFVGTEQSVCCMFPLLTLLLPPVASFQSAQPNVTKPFHP